MSLLGKKWLLKNPDIEKDLLTRLYENRNLHSPAEIHNFFHATLSNGLHDPFLLKNMEKMVNRSLEAIKNQEKIIVFGDYDVDGITSAGILFHALKLLGAIVSYRLPHRVNDGYGLNESVINEIKQLGVKLLITADCGIANEKIIEIARQKWIDVIVTDHHSIPDNFPLSAYAVVHPRQADCPYPFKELTGAGVALKCAQALLISAKKPNFEEEFYKLLDLAALGTIADIGPLSGENRIIVKYGIEAINKGLRPGIAHLKKIAWPEAEKYLHAEDIAFQITPRLNAAGRLESAYFALQCLLGEDKKAQKMAQYLDKLNRRRQKITEIALQKAEASIQDDLAQEKIIILKDPQYHAGILGLIAGKLSEKYGRPAIIMQDNGESLVASARSPEFFNLMEALEPHRNLLVHCGGHAQAAGFTVLKENLQKFTDQLRNFSSSLLGNNELKSTLTIDTEIRAPEINYALIQNLEKLRPYGHANEMPRFLIRNVSVTEMRKVGKDQSHLQIFWQQKGRYHRSIAFSFAKYLSQIRTMPKLDMVIRLQEGYKGREADVQVVDMREAG